MSKFTLQDLLPQDTDFYPKHPVTGEQLDFWIRLQGQWAPSVKRRSLEALSLLGGLRKAEQPEQLVKAVDDLRAVAIETAVAAIVCWDEESPLGKFSEEAKRTLMTDQKWEWLRTQINEFVGEQTNFFRQGAEGTPSIS